MDEPKDDRLDDVDVDVERKDREIEEIYETEVDPAKEGAIRPFTSHDATTPPPLPLETRAEGSPELFTAEALAGGERATPAPPGRQQVSQSYWSLVWWKFKKNRLGVVGGILILGYYITCVLFPEFFSPYLSVRESQY
jgi:peptide/nickel transport system permease protein